MIGIYKIENKINGKIYVGQSIHITKRWSQHKNNYLSSTHQSALYEAFKKYGLDNFTFSIIEECDLTELDNKEIFWITKLNTLVPNGYNISCGGQGRKNFLYDYKVISERYKEIGNSKKVAEEFNCDFKTVLNACHSYNIPMNCTKEKAVYQIDKDTDEILACYSNLHTAYREGLQRPYDSSISRVCRGVRKTAYGYKWKYVK